MPSDPSAERLEKTHRLHPTSLFFSIAASVWSLLIPGVLFFLFARGTRQDTVLMILFFPALLHAILKYVSLRYRLTPEALIIHEGILTRNTRNIPYDRIHNIDLVQNPIHRFLKVAEVRIETASGEEPEAVLRVLSAATVEELRRRASSVGPPGNLPAGHAGAITEPFEETAVFSMTLPGVLAFGLIANRGITLLFAAVYILWELNLAETITKYFQREFPRIPILMEALSIPLLIVAGILLLMGLSMLWAVLKLHGFTLQRDQDSLRISCGLFTRYTASIPRHRIQFLNVRENPIQRWFQRVSIRMQTAGGSAGDKTAASREWLVPMTRTTNLSRILREVQPEVDFDQTEWTPVDPRAKGRIFRRGLFLVIAIALAAVPQLHWWSGLLALALSLIAYANAALQVRTLGYALTPAAILLRRGWWTHERSAVRFSKVQSISMVRTPFDRRLLMASLRIDTAGSSNSPDRFRIPYLKLQTAIRLMGKLRIEAASSEFKW